MKTAFLALALVLLPAASLADEAIATGAGAPPATTAIADALPVDDVRRPARPTIRPASAGRRRRPARPAPRRPIASPMARSGARQVRAATARWAPSWPSRSATAPAWPSPSAAPKAAACGPAAAV